MRERIAYLERQVEEEREARRRADTLLVRLMDRMPVPEVPPGKPTPSQEALGGPQSAGAEPSGEETPPAGVGAQEAAEPRSWWRRAFGG